MGMHCFHGVPQLGHSQRCCLIELDEWTVTWIKQVDLPLPPSRPLLAQTLIYNHRHTWTSAHTHHPQRRVCTAARWNMAKKRPIILQTNDSSCGRPHHFSAAVWNHAVVGGWQLVSSSVALPFVYGTGHFKKTLYQQTVWVIVLRCHCVYLKDI